MDIFKITSYFIYKMNSSVTIPKDAATFSYDQVFDSLKKSLEGDLFTDISTRILYATDASVYKELPMAVCRPRNKNDLLKIVSFASKSEIPLIPRTAGTSLAGQVVGNGLVLDFSKYMTHILEFNAAERWIKVEPGVILDELNAFLKPHGLFFGPETSTSNRCMMGGMVANNSCGSHSLVYGSTRDHTLEIDTILSDGKEVTFKNITQEEFDEKCKGEDLENRIYRQIREVLTDSSIREEIVSNYPDRQIHRRNMGYALDLLLENEVFSDRKESFNFSTLLAGSEGSLALFTSIKLKLVDLPPSNSALVCVHFETLEEALKGNLIALKNQPVAVELIDKIVLDCTRSNITHAKNRFFIEGDPAAILAVEFSEHDPKLLDKKISLMVTKMKETGMGYHYPVLKGGDIGKVWALRKAGLGLLSNIPGDAKPVAVIEDTAVHTEKLPDFITELNRILDDQKITCVFYAHIGTGELHLRPILNLKKQEDVDKFRTIAVETAHLVKKYRGSLSGEHGDGRLRGEFIPLMFGNKIYNILKQIKHTWDPQNIFNPGKIVDTPSMITYLRYEPEKGTPALQTYFRYPESDGFLRGVEKCNGSGDCRKPATMKGVMCPSYHATTNEKDTTRARANILREFISNSDLRNPFDHKEIKDILDLCLSCKGCKSECPSNVDMGKYKAEFLQNYYDSNGVPFRSWLIANYNMMNKLGSIAPGIFNLFSQTAVFAPVTKKVTGFATKRSLPALSKVSLRKWASRNLPALNKESSKEKLVVLFCDEFTNYNDTQTGINACMLLSKLGYYIEMPEHGESGRAGLSKGLLKKVKKLADKNINALYPFAKEELPIVGIEPSAILSLRDEYKDLCSEELQEKAVVIAKQTMIIDEFICKEMDANKIDRTLFEERNQKIYLHGHCHQKALSKVDYTQRMLEIPNGYKVNHIECGCCGMAGSFGYEKEHYQVSMAIGELKLFPAVRSTEKEAYISAPGTSCRHQIFDGTGKTAFHPIDILYNALKDP